MTHIRQCIEILFFFLEKVYYTSCVRDYVTCIPAYRVYIVNKSI